MPSRERRRRDPSPGPADSPVGEVGAQTGRAGSAEAPPTPPLPQSRCAWCGGRGPAPAHRGNAHPGIQGTAHTVERAGSLAGLRHHRGGRKCFSAGVGPHTLPGNTLQSRPATVSAGQLFRERFHGAWEADVRSTRWTRGRSFLTSNQGPKSCLQTEEASCSL